MLIYLQLAFEFFKAGLFAVGGGLATLPFLMQMSVKYPQWFSLNELMQMVAISESTPGSIGVNMATYVGFHIAGLPGALTATFSLVLPSFTVILIVVHVLDRFKNSRLISGGLEALRPAVTGLIGAAGYVVAKSAILPEVSGVLTFQWISFFLFSLLLGSLRVKKLSKLHPIVYIAVGAVLGIVLKL